ncbi:hypothetical protein JCM6882_007596 [Rhodosporidiobolus microsporus]
MQPQRVQAVEKYFSAVLEGRFDDIPSLFAPDATWQVGPPSWAAKAPNGGLLTIPQLVESVKMVGENMLAKAEPNVVHRTIQGEDSLATRITSRATTKDGSPFEMDLILFVDFVPKSASIKHIHETADSAYILEHVKRMTGGGEEAQKA